MTMQPMRNSRGRAVDPPRGRARGSPMPAAKSLELQLGAVELGQADEESCESALLGGGAGVCGMFWDIHCESVSPTLDLQSGSHSRLMVALTTWSTVTCLPW